MYYGISDKEYVIGMYEYIEKLKSLPVTDELKKELTDSLIRSGCLDKDGNPHDIVGQREPIFDIRDVASQIKTIEPDNISVKVRRLGMKYEVWVICKEKKYEILEEISSISEKSLHYLDIVFVSEQQLKPADFIEFDFVI